jgi:hypothetical protein
LKIAYFKLFQNKNFGFTQKKVQIEFGHLNFLFYFCRTIKLLTNKTFKAMKIVEGKHAGNIVKGSAKGKTVTFNNNTFTCLGKGKWESSNKKVDWIVLSAMLSALDTQKVTFE